MLQIVMTAAVRDVIMSGELTFCTLLSSRKKLVANEPSFMLWRSFLSTSSGSVGSGRRSSRLASTTILVVEWGDSGGEQGGEHSPFHQIPTSNCNR